MVTNELYNRAKSDVFRVLDWIDEEAPENGPVTTWDPKFVFQFAYRLRADGDYQEAVRSLSIVAACGVFRYPDVTADPGKLGPGESFAAWLAAAEDLARMAIDEMIADEDRALKDSDDADEDADEDANESAFDARELLGKALDFFLSAPAPTGAAAEPAQVWASPRSAAELYSITQGPGSDAGSAILNVRKPGIWFHKVKNQPVPGGRVFEIPKTAQLSAASVLLWARLPKGDVLVRGEERPAGSGAVGVFFSLADGAVEHALCQYDDVFDNFTERLERYDRPGARAAARLIARSGLADDFADVLDRLARNPDARAQAVARAARR